MCAHTPEDDRCALNHPADPPPTPEKTLRIPTADAAVCLALALLLLSSYVLNSYIFPVVAGVFPLGREISTCCGVVFSLVIAFAAYRKPALIHERRWSLACLSLFGAGLFMLLAGISTSSTLLVALGSPFGGIGAVWFSVLVGLALIKLGVARSIIVIPLAFMLKYLVQIALSSMDATLPFAAALVIYFACNALSYLLIHPHIKNLLSSIRRTASPTVLDVTNPSSFLPFSSPIFVSIFLFNAACGYAFASQQAALSPLSSMLTFTPVILVFVFAMVARTRFSADALYQAATLLVFAGFLTMPLMLASSNTFGGNSLSSILLYAGSDCFGALTYFVVTAVGARNLLGSLSTSAFAVAAGWLGIGVGALAAQAADSLSSHDPLPMMWAMAAFAFVFMAYNFVGLKNFSFDTAIRGIRPVPSTLTGISDIQESAGEQTAVSPNLAELETSSFEQSCSAIAQRHKLTNREVDVLILLARGRTSPVIQEKLFLSHNTIKTHVRHIYTKMDIHSQQELIDMVEGEIKEKD